MKRGTTLGAVLAIVALLAGLGSGTAAAGGSAYCGDIVMVVSDKTQNAAYWKCAAPYRFELVMV